MARLRRYCPAGISQHVIQRGNNRTVFFASDEDMSAYTHYPEEAVPGSGRFRQEIEALRSRRQHLLKRGTKGQLKP